MSPFMPAPPPIQPPLPSGVSNLLLNSYNCNLLSIVYLDIEFILSLFHVKIGMKHPAKPMEEEPQAKKLRTEDSLIPEQQFLARNKVLNKC